MRTSRILRRFQPARAITLATIFALSISSISTSLFAGDAATTGLSKLVRDARQLEKNGKLEEALDRYQEAVLLLPENRTLRSRMKRSRSKLAKSKYDAAKKALAEDDSQAAKKALVESWALVPTRRTRDRLRKLGYREHRGAWRSSIEIDKFENAEETREADARNRLGLDNKFRVVRSDHFRVLTNLPEGRQWDRWLAPVMKVMESQLAHYSEMFRGDVDLHAAREGLDVVFFHTDDDYRDYLRARRIQFSFTTAGFYSSSDRACFFYRNANYAKVWPILLHELTHELSDLLLGAGRVAWISEGLAQYYESAIVHKNHSLTVGRPHHRRLSALRLRAAKNESLSVEQILRTRSVHHAVAHGEGRSSDVYATMWGVTYFLLHSSIENRTKLIDGLRFERLAWKESQGPTTARKIYVEILNGSDSDREKLELEYEQFIKKVRLTKN